MNIPIYIHYIILGLGVLSNIIGIIVGIRAIKPPINRKKFKINNFKTSIIYILIGLLFILIFIIFKPECKLPEIRIKSLVNNDMVDEYIDVEGKVSCLNPDTKISLIIHQFEQDNIQERWFIHAECAAIESKNSWKFSNVEIGTYNMKGKEFEIFAYVTNDTICEIIHRTVNNLNPPL